MAQPLDAGTRHRRPLESLGMTAIVVLLANMVVRAVFWFANLRNYQVLDDYAKRDTMSVPTAQRDLFLQRWRDSAQYMAAAPGFRRTRMFQAADDLPPRPRTGTRRGAAPVTADY